MKKVILTAILFVFVLSGCGAQLIGEDAAKKIALGHAGISENEVLFKRVERDRDDGRYIYEVEFRTKDLSEFEYEIDAENGNIISFDSDLNNYIQKK